MENGNGDGGGVGGGNQTISCDDVISKLKDDGDFDRIRLKIIRKLKENVLTSNLPISNPHCLKLVAGVYGRILIIKLLDFNGGSDVISIFAGGKGGLIEELRSSIVSIVKQSVALNRPGAENMKPRQLSDAIHQEVGAKVNEEISSGLWEIIRSADGIKTEITETVKSVYNKLSAPNRVEIPEPSGHDPKRIRIQINGMSEPEPKDHISLPETLDQSKHVLGKEHVGPSPPPGGVQVQQKDEINASDEDPDAPPGFG